jgi:hypothetical protein
VIADLTATLKKVADVHDLTMTPDGRGYWKFHDKLQAIIEIVPFDKIVDGTRARHEAFFSKLGIN